ncbi:hypothetical protein ACFS07_24210 [Undibacterium arcticum]
MQHDLHHGEFVEVGIEQRLDDHGGWLMTAMTAMSANIGATEAPWRIAIGQYTPCDAAELRI